MISKVVNLNERLVLSTDDFYVAINDSFRYRRELGVNRYYDKEIRKKSHFVIGLTLV